MRFIDTLIDLLYCLNLYYDRSRHAPPPYGDKPPPKVVKKAVTQKQYTEKYGIPYEEDETGTRTMDWGDRDPAMNSLDKEALSEHVTLKEDKYAAIKGQWAIKGMTAIKASSILQSRYNRGYGQRTVEKYWKVINATNAPPLVVG